VSAYPPPGRLGPWLIAAWSFRTRAHRVRVEGLEHIPAHGPVLIVARHYHHLLDAAVMLHHVRRPVHIVVALDWTADPAQRRWMERACRWAQWPVILRPATTGARGGYAADDVRAYLRSGLRDAADLLRDGRVVAIFPEGYPAIEPAGSSAPPRARDEAGFLPFAAGFRTIVSLARKRGAGAVALVPLGLRYDRTATGRWNVTARFGAPLDPASDGAAAEAAVRELSR